MQVKNKTKIIKVKKIFRYFVTEFDFEITKL